MIFDVFRGYRKGTLASFSDIIEREPWHQMDWPEKINISANSNYAID